MAVRSKQKRLERGLLVASLVSGVLAVLGLVAIYLPDRIGGSVPLDYRLSYAVAADGSAEVVETLDYDFTAPRSVVKRRYPAGPDGSRPASWSVTRNGVPMPISLGRTEYAIGDPRIGYTGRQRYEIRYRLPSAFDASGDFVLRQGLSPRRGVDLRSFRIDLTFARDVRVLDCRIGGRACRVIGAGSRNLGVRSGPLEPAVEFLLRLAPGDR